jgi:hypothetical protein
MKVSVTSANSARKFLKAVPFEFESESLTREEVLKDGKMAFLKLFQERLKTDREMASRIGALRYRIHATEVVPVEYALTSEADRA